MLTSQFSLTRSKAALVSLGPSLVAFGNFITYPSSYSFPSFTPSMKRKTHKLPLKLYLHTFVAHTHTHMHITTTASANTWPSVAAAAAAVTAFSQHRENHEVNNDDYHYARIIAPPQCAPIMNAKCI